MIVTKTKLTREQLAAVKLRTPANAGAYWRGIQHAELVDAVIAAHTRLGWKCSFDAAAMSNDKADIVASFVVEDMKGAEIPKGFEAMIAIKNSNAKRWGLSLTVGIRHELRGTVIVLGRVPMSPVGSKRGEFKLDESMQAALVAAFDLFQKADAVVKTMTGELDAAGAQFFMIALGSRGTLPWKRIGAAVEALNQLTPSAWTLLCVLSDQIDKAPTCARRDQLELRFELCQQLRHALTGEIPRKLATEIA